MPSSSRTSDTRLPSEPRIVFIGTHIGDPRWPAIEGGARRASRVLSKMKLEFIVPEDTSAVSKARAVSETLDRKPHVLCICVDQNAEDAEHVRELARTGFVIAVGAPLDAPEAAARVVVDWGDAAALLGERLPTILADKRSYVLLHEEGRSLAGTRCHDRFEQTVARHSAPVRLEERSTVGQAGAPATPATLVREMVANYRHVALVVTLTPAPWLERPPAELLSRENRLATLGAAPPLWPFLRDGSAAALVGPVDGDIGAAAVDLAVRVLIEGKRLDVVRAIPFELVTPENVRGFAARYERSAGETK